MAGAGSFLAIAYRRMNGSDIYLSQLFHWLATAAAVVVVAGWQRNGEDRSIPLCEAGTDTHTHTHTHTLKH